MNKTLLIAASLLALSSCTVSNKTRPVKITWPEKSLSVEMCFPNSTDPADYDVEVSRVEQTSAGGEMTLHVGMTTNNQPVYRSEVAFMRVGKAIVIHVKDRRKSEQVYVIQIPLKVSLKPGDWSAWVTPTYRSSDLRPELPLLYGSKEHNGVRVEALELDSLAPQVRYLSQPFNDGTKWIEERRIQGLQSGLPPC